MPYRPPTVTLPADLFLYPVSNAASFIQDGQVVNIEGKDLMWVERVQPVALTSLTSLCRQERC